ncbi:glycosyltransferase family 2 protein [Candidatus Woesearchaeota archaeon]|nr:glycosyltransferase family 2 protein [Candidatus Woesearchaeota archaeon]
MNIFVVMPAHNEEKRIGDVLRELNNLGYNNIIVVDDGSVDNTYEIAKREEATVLRHIINLGKGAAAKTGCDFAIKNGAEKIILIDADGQHDPHELPQFIAALDNKDIVFGYRKFTKTMPFMMRFGNKFINVVTKLLYGMNLRDTQCGYRALTAKAYKIVRWNSTDYAMESEMIANAGKHHLKYGEIQIQTIYNEKYKGTTMIDGIKIVLNMFLWRFKE